MQHLRGSAAEDWTHITAGFSDIRQLLIHENLEVHAYIYAPCMHACMQVCMHPSHITHTYIHADVHIYLPTNIYVHTHTHTRTRTHRHRHTHARTHARARTHTHTGGSSIVCELACSGTYICDSVDIYIILTYWIND